MDAEAVEYVNRRLDGIAMRIYPLAAASIEGRTSETFREFVRRSFFGSVNARDVCLEDIAKEIDPSIGSRTRKYDKWLLDLLTNALENELRNHYPAGRA